MSLNFFIGMERCRVSVSSQALRFLSSSIGLNTIRNSLVGKEDTHSVPGSFLLIQGWAAPWWNLAAQAIHTKRLHSAGVLLLCF